MANRTWQPKPCHMNGFRRGRALSATESILGCHNGSREPPTFYWLAWRAIPAACRSKHDAQIPPTRVRVPWGGGQAVIGPFCGAGQTNCRTYQPTASDPTTPKTAGILGMSDLPYQPDDFRENAIKQNPLPCLTPDSPDGPAVSQYLKRVCHTFQWLAISGPEKV